VDNSPANFTQPPYVNGGYSKQQQPERPMSSRARPIDSGMYGSPRHEERPFQNTPQYAPQHAHDRNEYYGRREDPYERPTSRAPENPLFTTWNEPSEKDLYNDLMAPQRMNATAVPREYSHHQKSDPTRIHPQEQTYRATRTPEPPAVSAAYAPRDPYDRYSMYGPAEPVRNRHYAPNVPSYTPSTVSAYDYQDRNDFYSHANAMMEEPFDTLYGPPRSRRYR